MLENWDETPDTMLELQVRIALQGVQFREGEEGLYEFFRDKYTGERKHYDMIPPLVEKKYLKTIINCHRCAGSLDKGDLDGDGEITVLDIDHVLH